MLSMATAIVKRHNGKPDEAKVSRPVWGEAWGKPHEETHVWRPCAYSTGA